jgi:RimJ/RimL family protein N-acetyltransferase
VRVLYGHDAEVTHWVCERIPHLRERIPHFEKGLVLGPTVALGVLDRAGTLIAGVVFHGYDPFVKAMEVSCASDGARWGNREVFREVLRYSFETADCQRISAVTPRRATSPRRFLEGLGFQREGSIRRGFGTDNAIIYGLLREDWANGRFCRPRERGELTDGQEIPQPAAAA